MTRTVMAASATLTVDDGPDFAFTSAKGKRRRIRVGVVQFHWTDSVLKTIYVGGRELRDDDTEIAWSVLRYTYTELQFPGRPPWLLDLMAERGWL